MTIPVNRQIDESFNGKLRLGEVFRPLFCGE